MKRTTRCIVRHLALVGGAATLLHGQSGVPSFTLDQRWHYYLHRTYSMERIGLLAADTAFEHVMSPDDGRHPKFYPEHYGTAFARRIARTTAEFGAGALLREDARRRPSNKSGFLTRVIWAATHSMLATGPNGSWRPAYSRFAGTLSGFLVHSAIRDRPLTGRRLGMAYTGMAMFSVQDSLLTEFQPEIQRIGFGMARKVFGSFRRTRSNRATIATVNQ